MSKAKQGGATNQLTRSIALTMASVVVFFTASCSVMDKRASKKAFAPDLGVCTSVDNASLLKEKGFDYVEESVGRFLMPLEPVQKFDAKLAELQQSDFPAYACNGFIPGSLKSTGPDAQHDKILQYVETAFERAQRAAINRIVFGSSGSRKIPDGFDREQAKAQFVELLKRMGPIAKKYDVVVVIEPLNTKECNFITSVTEGAEIARMVDHPNIKLLADIYHMLRENEGPESIIAAGDLLKHVHIAENKERWYPGRNNEDFTPYLAALKQTGYTGSISMEGRWDKFAEELPIAIAYLKDQIDKVNKIPVF